MAATRSPWASLLRKVSGGVRLKLDPDVRRIVARESRRPAPAPDPGVGPRVEAADAEAGLELVAIGGHRYWLPSGIDAPGLAAIHAEVFDPSHPHHYEHEGCRLRPGDVAVDAGACEGFFVRYALERGASVLAVEPWGPLADGLRRTFAPEIAAGRVAVAQVTLADAPGRVELHADPAQPWGASIAPAAGLGWTGRQAVDQIAIDALVAGSPFGRCDFLKMDIEGFERAAIAGAREVLRRDRPCLSIAVYHRPTGYMDIRDDLRALGLGYAVDGKGLDSRRSVRFPMMLHAWDPARGASANGRRGEALPDAVGGRRA